MSLKDTLTAGLAQVPDCRAVCYIDISAALVLATSGQTYPQEHLDAIAVAARQILDGAVAKGLQGAEDGVDCAFLYGNSDTHVFVRSSSIHDHALCYICSDAADPEKVRVAALENRAAVSAIIR